MKPSSNETRAVLGLILLTLLVVPASAQRAQDNSHNAPASPETMAPEGRTGRAVDSRGGQVVDPSENVKALSEAASRRQDDLRAALEKLTEAKLFHVKELEEIYFQRNKELREAAVNRLDTELKLRADYEEKLRNAEAKRIDAIRLVDVGAATTLAQRTTEQATALATVVTQSAEVLRNQVSRAAEDTRALVATTAATALQNQQQQFQAITTRLAALEQTGAEGRGKQTFQDPAFVEVLKEVRSLSQSRSAVGGAGDFAGWILAGILALVAIVGLFWKNRPPAPSAAA